MTVDGGGYILAASHTIPPETPMENIFAMYAEAELTARPFSIAPRTPGRPPKSTACCHRSS